MPSRERKRRKKLQEEYVLNRDYELESSRVRYYADAEQRRAFARDIMAVVNHKNLGGGAN